MNKNTRNKKATIKTKTELIMTRNVDDVGKHNIEVTPLVENVRVLSVDKDGIRHIGLRSEEDLRAYASIPDEWTTQYFRPNSWTQQDKKGPFVAHQVRAVFIPPPREFAVLENLLKDIQNSRPPNPRMVDFAQFEDDNDGPLMLEIDIFDVHLGMVSFKGSADENYDMNIAKNLYWNSLNEILYRALSKDNKISKILLPVGNDFLHVDNVIGSTTKGTKQPEATYWGETFKEGIKLLTDTINKLETIAPVHVVVIPGNHDYFSSLHLGHVLAAYYHNDHNVEIDHSDSPYKFVEWGVNLIGFEHGNNSKHQTIRLAALMAQEKPEAWARTKYREWHLGDQHRKSTVFEEMGVSIEFLPALVPANSWHRENLFNHQKRGAVGFVWSKKRGPINKIMVNLL
jgi:hypothetical protein